MPFENSSQDGDSNQLLLKTEILSSSPPQCLIYQKLPIQQELNKFNLNNTKTTTKCNNNLINPNQIHQNSGQKHLNINISPISSCSTPTNCSPPYNINIYGNNEQQQNIGRLIRSNNANDGNDDNNNDYLNQPFNMSRQQNLEHENIGRFSSLPSTPCTTHLQHPFVHPQQQQSSSSNLQQDLGNCPICNDKVSGYHYGLLTCESCKVISIFVI
uniref:Nuclear receptor domain-containing protein n=1 Tax=Meloidogyne floridensis TaxID=298350 RepID=A0A915P6K3_9BILA